MLTLDRLKYFIEAATLEHVGLAAKNAHVSPSVISSAINSLEDEFNCELFIRENNRIKLNDKGHVLLEKARALIASTNQLYTEMDGENSLIKGHYRLGGSHFLMRELLVPTFLKLHKNHPSITAEFISSDTSLAISNVLSGALDAALVFRSSFKYDLEEHVLKEGQFYIAVKKKHEVFELPKAKRVELLNSLPALAFKPAVGPNFTEHHPVFKEFKISPRNTFYYDDDQTAVQLLLKTNGWALLPEMMIEKYADKIEKVVISKDWKAPVTISLIRNKNKTSCRFTSQLIEMIKASYIS
jgi:DNA-binding transcriptional LysR family regulator